jgi:ParB-like nuclease domain
MLATDLIDQRSEALPRDQQKIQRIAKFLKSGHMFDPIQVFYQSFTGGRYVVSEGRHRLDAHKLLRIPFILAQLYMPWYRSNDADAGASNTRV